jgi:uncharacterized membrane protein
MLFVALKFLHVLAAIIAVGFNATYGLLIGRARASGTDDRVMRFALGTIKVMDDYVANPCYILLLITGVGMVQVAGYPWKLMWIHGSLALLVIIAVLGFGAYTPTLRKQIAVLESRGSSDPEFARLGTRGAILGGIIALMVMVIIALMVFKPS